MNFIKKLNTKLDGHLFKDWGPLNLGASRLFFYLFAFYTFFVDTQYRWPHPLIAWGEIGEPWWSPVGIFNFFSAPPLSGKSLYYLVQVFKISILFSAIGLFTRISTLLAFLCSLILLGYPPSFGQGTGNSEGIFVFACLILFLSRSGDSLSIDSLLFKKRTLLNWKGSYSWPIIFMRYFLLLLFFQAGFQKIRTGFDFVNTDFLAIHLHFSGSPFGGWVSNYGNLPHALAGLILLVELSVFSVLWKEKWSKYFAMIFFMMQMCFFYFLGIRFMAFKAVYIFWIPWEYLIKRNYKTKNLQPQSDQIKMHDYKNVIRTFVIILFSTSLIEMILLKRWWPFTGFDMFTSKYYGDGNKFHLGALYFETSTGKLIDVPVKMFEPMLRHQSLYYLISLEKKGRFDKINLALTELFTRTQSQNKEYFREYELKGEPLLKIKAFRLQWESTTLEEVRNSRPSLLYLGESTS